MDALPEWTGTVPFVAMVVGLEIVVGVILWYGPVVLERRTVECLRPVAAVLLGVAVVTVMASLAVDGFRALRLGLGLPPLVYLAYTWSDSYLDRVERSRLQSAGGRRLGGWRRGLDRGNGRR